MTIIVPEWVLWVLGIGIWFVLIPLSVLGLFALINLCKFR